MQALILMMFTAYFAYSYQVFSIGTYGVTSLDLITVVFYLVFIIKIFWNGEGLRFRLNYSFYFILVLLLASLLSFLLPAISSNADFITQYFKTTLHLFFLVIFTIICALYPLKPRIWTNVIKLWLILSLFINVFGVYQIVARAFDLPLAWLDSTNVSFGSRGMMDVSEFKQISLQFEGFFRATSIFSEPSALAIFNLFIVIFIVIPFLQGKPQFLKSKALTIVIFISSLIALMLSFSLSGVLGLGLIIGFGILTHWSKRVIAFLPVVFAALILIIIADAVVYSYANISVISLFEQRVSGIITGRSDSDLISGESFGGRKESIESTLTAWERSPLTGLGMGQYGFHNSSGQRFSDNGASLALAEMGVQGFLAFVGIFAALFITTYRLMKSRRIRSLPDEEQRLAGLLFYMMIVLFEMNFLTGNHLVAFDLWNMLGMILSIINYIYIKTSQSTYSIAWVNRPFKLRVMSYLTGYKNLQGLRPENAQPGSL